MERINKDHKPRTWKILAKLFRLYKMRKSVRKLILEIYEGARLQETKILSVPFMLEAISGLIKFEWKFHFVSIVFIF